MSERAQAVAHEGAAHAPARGRHKMGTHESTLRAAGDLALRRMLAEDARALPLPPDSHEQGEIEGSHHLFVKAPHDHHPIDPLDVEQGQLGDCYFMAAIAAVAHANPHLIRNLIKQLGPNTYQVTLFGTNDRFKGTGPHTVIVDDRFPLRDHKHPAYAQSHSPAGSAETELWVLLLEKAYATLAGGYDKIEGGLGAEGLDLLLEHKARTYYTADHDAKQLGKLIDQALKASRPVVTETDMDPGTVTWDDFIERNRTWLPQSLVSPERRHLDEANVAINHVYTVARVHLDEQRITLQNPWGVDHLSLSFDQYKQLFYSYEIGSP